MRSHFRCLARSPLYEYPLFVLGSVLCIFERANKYSGFEEEKYNINEPTDLPNFSCTVDGAVSLSTISSLIRRAVNEGDWLWMTFSFWRFLSLTVSFFAVTCSFLDRSRFVPFQCMRAPAEVRECCSVVLNHMWSKSHSKPSIFRPLFSRPQNILP